MKRTITRTVLASACLFFAVSIFSAPDANAGEFGDLNKKMLEARDSLLTLLKNKEKRGPAQQKLVKESADAVSAQLKKMKAPAGKEAQFKEMSEAWYAFKKTRENELVPAILAGKQEEAEKIGGGIQKTRFKKFTEISAELDK